MVVARRRWFAGECSAVVFRPAQGNRERLDIRLFESVAFSFLLPNRDLDRVVTTQSAISVFSLLTSSPQYIFLY